MIKMKALIMGRFQPFHNGHLKAIKMIIAKNDEVVIGIGSSQYSHTKDNPYSFTERRKMVKSVFPDLVVKPVKDIHDNKRWCSHVKDTFNFDIIYSGSGLNYELLSKELDVKKLPRYYQISGTKIRSLISAGKKWEHLVPVPVVKIMKNIGLDRIK